MEKPKSENQLNYHRYRLSFRQRFLYGIIGGTGTAVLTAVFYRNPVILAVMGIGGALIFPELQKKKLIRQRQAKLRDEFKEALYSLIVSLRAGRSLEGAFVAALEDMDPEMTPYIYQEWKEIARQFSVGFQIEECLENFAERSGIEEIRSFARTIEVCKRSEGDMARVMENTIHLLQDRLEIQMELRVLLAKKKTEQKILNLMPIVVIGLLMLMSPEYLSPLYHSFQGAVIMTVCLILTIVSYILSKKISEIAL